MIKFIRSINLIKMRKLIFSILLAIIFQTCYSHPWKPAHYVIIDTDAGLDDMRAISMLLASNDVKVLGIIVSGGALSPYDGYKKVKSMLDSYHHNGIPIAMNYNIRGHDMPVPLSLSWGNENGLMVPETNGFNKLCKILCKYENAEISFISMGSLNSIAELVNGGILPENRIKEIIWSNDSRNKLNGFNASIDARSANRIVKGNIPLISVGYSGEAIFYDDSYIKELKEVANRYSNKIAEVAESNPDLKNHNFASTAADEMIAIYLHYPELFVTTESKNHKFQEPGDIVDLKKVAITILKGENDRGRQVMKELPVDTSFYQPDLQPFISEIIRQHGKEEWESGIIANEMHRHLGIYSVIGVKMGILAREYFDVGVDEMELNSFAGSTPPLSCMNDGLQVSTGATTGHGLLRVDQSELSPSAEFKHNGYRIRISLKTDLATEISEELKELMIVNGLDSDIYWEIVRQRAILHWKNLNKYEIFDIEVLEPES
jgi:pyrimidine-specific ribonucleoside hydrolase